MCFNSRTREGCDIAPIGNLTTPREGFNSRTREGCDDHLFGQSISPLGFQFTHPGGVRHNKARILIMTLRFQFTHPGGVRLRMIRRTHSFPTRFNSRTREGCDEQYP